MQVDNMDSKTEEQFNFIFYYGAYTIWKYLDELFQIDIREVCQRVAKEQPTLKTMDGHLLIAEIVDLPCENELTDLQNKNDITFFINALNVVFESLKSGIEKDGEKVLFKYRFQMDSDHNLFLVDDEGMMVSNKGISITKKK